MKNNPDMIKYWPVLERVFDIVLKLAPAELRNPPEFLDQVYDLKLYFKKTILMSQSPVEENKEDALEEFENQCVSNCHANPKECKFTPGSSRCILRRDRYNKATEYKTKKADQNKK